MGVDPYAALRLVGQQPLQNQQQQGGGFNPQGGYQNQQQNPQYR
jgi:hypothetical protein